MGFASMYVTVQYTLTSKCCSPLIMMGLGGSFVSRCRDEVISGFRKLQWTIVRTRLNVFSN